MQYYTLSATRPRKRKSCPCSCPRRRRPRRRLRVYPLPTSSPRLPISPSPPAPAPQPAKQLCPPDPEHGDDPGLYIKPQAIARASSASSWGNNTPVADNCRQRGAQHCDTAPVPSQESRDRARDRLAVAPTSRVTLAAQRRRFPNPQCPRRRGGGRCHILRGSQGNPRDVVHCAVVRLCAPGPL